MSKYMIKRVLSALLTVLVVFSLNFVIINAAPGSPIKTMMGKEVDNIELQKALEKKYGFDQPLHKQYLKYLKNVSKGDLGVSVIYNRPVKDMILEKMGPTVLLVLSSAIISLILGTAMGISAARREGSLLDVIFSSVNYILNSMPSFWLGLMLVIIFSTKLNLLPTFGMTDPRADYTGIDYFVDVLKHLVLPVLTMVLIQIPLYFRIAKSSVLQVVNEDYIQTFRACGMSEEKAFNKYIFKNAILPTITIFGISIAYLVTGVALVEIIFAWPGTGRLVLNAINQRDYPTLMGIYLVMSISIAVVMMLVDIIYAFVDPRIRYGD